MENIINTTGRVDPKVLIAHTIKQLNRTADSFANVHSSPKAKELGKGLHRIVEVLNELPPNGENKGKTFSALTKNGGVIDHFFETAIKLVDHAIKKMLPKEKPEEQITEIPATSSGIFSRFFQRTASANGNKEERKEISNDDPKNHSLGLIDLTKLRYALEVIRNIIFGRFDKLFEMPETVLALLSKPQETAKQV